MSDEVADIHGRRWPHGGRRSHRDEAVLLADKARACRARLPDVLDHLGAAADPHGWTVHPVVVTSVLSPAGLIADPIVLFCRLHDLVGVVALPALPSAGLVLLDPLAHG